MLFTLAVLSGVSFTLIGIAYRLGQSRGVAPLRIALIFSAMAAVFFGVKAWGVSLADVPAEAFVWSGIVAVGQYMTIKLVRVALMRGPLSPMWCATSLGFVAAVVYALLFLEEEIGWTGSAGVVTGVLCVLAGSGQQKSAGESRGVSGSRAFYGLVLFLLLISNSLAFVAIKDLASRTAAPGETYMDAYGDVYFAFYYGAVAVMVAIDLCLVRRGRVSVVQWLGLGLLAGVGVVGGATALAACVSKLEAAVIFTASSISSILTGAFASVLFFREKASRAFFVMVALGVLAVVLVRIHELLT